MGSSPTRKPSAPSSSRPRERPAREAFGLAADEWDLARRSATNPLGGTHPQVLADVLSERYGSRGLEFEYRRFGSVDEVLAHEGALVVIDWAQLVNHVVAVIESGDDAIVLGDPVRGRQEMTRTGFERVWQRVALVAERR